EFGLQPMLRLLQSFLPSRAGRVLWAGEAAEGIAGDLAAAGLRVTVAEIPDAPLRPPASLSPAAYDLLVLPAGLGGNPAARLATARGLLAPEGRLLLVTPEAQAREAVVALSEAGYVVLREESAGEGREALLARPDLFFVRAYRPGDEAA